jgi:heat shock protein HslJ/uncharacterized lipoprotein YbaY
MDMPRVFPVVLLIAAGCAALPEAAPSSSLIGPWVVERLGGDPVVGAAPLTVEFDETRRVFGSGGCNRYTGAFSWDAESGTLTMTPLGVTRRACLDPALAAQEQKLIDALQRATRTETQEGGLALVGDGARIEIRRRTDRLASSAAAPAPVEVAAAPSPAPAAGAPLRPAPASTSSYPLSGAPASSAATPTTISPPAPTPSLPTNARLRVSGEVSLAAPASLPAGAIVRVQVRDISRTPATVIGQQDQPASAGAPFAFAVDAPTSVVGPNAQLTLVAQILSGERLLYITDSANPVPVGGAAGLAVRVVPAARMPGAGPTAPASATVATGSALRPAPAPVDIPNSTPWRCRGESFRIAFEDDAALLTTVDGAVARLARIDASDDPGAPRMFSNSILTVLRESSTGAVRFARGRAALTTCEPG